MTDFNLAIFISGRGSNMAALIEAAASPDYPAKISLVISNNPDAPGLKIAEDANIPTAIIDHRAYDNKQSFETALQTCLSQYRIDLICLAGFMRLLSADFVTDWQNKIVNIHPSLLPSFKGLDPHQQAIDTGVCVSGCTVHFVTAEMDGGPILSQACVPVFPEDNAKTLSSRVLTAEHRLYAQTVKWIAEGYVDYDGPRPTINLPETQMSKVTCYPD